MGLFRKKGRSDIDAWAKVMIQGYKKGMPIDKAVLEQATDQSIRNDCRIIRESVQIVMRSSDYEVCEKQMPKLEIIRDIDDIDKTINNKEKDINSLEDTASFCRCGSVEII